MENKMTPEQYFALRSEILRIMDVLLIIKSIFVALGFLLIIIGAKMLDIVLGTMGGIIFVTMAIAARRPTKLKAKLDLLRMMRSNGESFEHAAIKLDLWDEKDGKITPGAFI